MSTWKRLNETLPDKREFYSSLNMWDITDADHKHAKRIWKDFRIKNVGEHHDLYIQNDTQWLANAFESFCNKCHEMYELDPAHFFSTRSSIASVL